MGRVRGYGTPPECHPDRKHQAFGLCGSCYNQRGVNSRRAECHPDRGHYARGLCVRCYVKDDTHRRQADCHPDRLNRGLGMCTPCYMRFKHYGLEPGDYDRMVEAQNGRCAICGEDDLELVLDHSHETGENRGLLCSACNTAIGLMRENEAYLLSAIGYLSAWVQREGQQTIVSPRRADD